MYALCKAIGSDTKKDAAQGSMVPSDGQRKSHLIELLCTNVASLDLHHTAGLLLGGKLYIGLLVLLSGRQRPVQLGRLDLLVVERGDLGSRQNYKLSSSGHESGAVTWVDPANTIQGKERLAA
jgi:hypothetical protein